ncbi:MAG: glycosyltransferase family 4 protein [Anaerolineales bacterium]|jgi:glycosyltransferase involved in cell wall biosynthesis|nr:glycosyltransferase family 4 protein [Anaerolineales bacterium]GER80060.1 glycosyltransferase family 4 protein [Candidatus Denitrolinea symbiosum]
MRIFCFTDRFLPTIGGAELAVHNLAEGLVSLGHEVLVSTSTRQGYPAHRHNYELERFWLPRGSERFGFVEWWIGWHLVRSISRWRPDIVQINYAWPGGYAAIKNKNRIKVPIIITSHGSDIQYIPEIGYGDRLNPKRDRMIVHALRHADGLIAISNDIYNEYVKLGVSEQLITLIPNGICFHTLARRNEQARRSLGINSGQLVILAVGRNHPKKGFNYLIQAMSLIAPKNPVALCLIVGKGVSSLAPVVEQMGVTEHVRLCSQALPVGIDFSGRIMPDSEKIETYFKAADIYAMPSLIEGMPLVALEAMASGLPLIASLQGASEDLVVDGKNGLLIPAEDVSALADALQVLLGDKKLRKMMGNVSRLKAKSYDRDHIANEHLRYFKKFI